MKFTRRAFLAGCATSLVVASANGRRSGWAGTGATGLAEDVLRPRYHLLPAANWMNDPDGPIYWRGQYHMFYQYNPNGAFWGDMHWAHSVSPDMVHWRHLPVALAPTPKSADQDGCFTGTTVIDHGVPTIIYTGVATTAPDQATLRDGEHNFRETQCLATSTDSDLRTWTKLPQPVIPAPPPGPPVTGFRDPCVWVDGDLWYAALGSGYAKKGGAIFLYRSRDLRTWEYLHPLLTGTWTGKDARNPVESGEMWECPDFFALGSKYVLLYSTEGKVYWLVGSYDKGELKFHPDRRGLLDSGSYYAPKSMVDGAGNRILWGWIPETRPLSEYKTSGWAGVMALPRALTVGPSGDLEMRVANGFEALRGKLQTDIQSLSFASFSAELKAEFSLGEKPFAVSFGQEPSRYLDVRYEPADNSLRVNQQELSFAPNSDKSVELHIFMDGSVIEVFVNNRHAHTVRTYLPGKDSSRTSVRIDGPARGVHLWEIEAISADRLTT